MSHTKRYWIDDHSAIEDSDGKWVLYSDHAALVQQGIRDHADWRSKLNFLEADYKAEIARLTAENERLKESNNIKRQVIDRLKSEVLHLGSIADVLTEVADEMILRHPADCDISEALESIKKEREI